MFDTFSEQIHKDHMMDKLSLNLFKVIILSSRLHMTDLTMF